MFFFTNSSKEDAIKITLFKLILSNHKSRDINFFTRNQFVLLSNIKGFIVLIKFEFIDH